MRRRTLLVLFVVGIVRNTFGGEPTSVEPLLRTQWGQRGDYAAFAPRQQRVGCWSTAIGQILRFHGLAPRGDVQYRTSAGTSLKLDLESHAFDFQKLTDSFSTRTPVAHKREVAGYLYCVSLAIQKDFGTGSYILSHRARADAVSQHFACTATLHETPTKSLRQIGELIKSELDSERPVMMHVRSRKKDYHAVAVDGYRIQNGVFYMHVNMGHGGKEDGWYRSDRAIAIYDDIPYRKVMTITPHDTESRTAG
ncbi:MAG: C10 family peptidase [Planctomycetaceae bacterium]